MEQLQSLLKTVRWISRKLEKMAFINMGKIHKTLGGNIMVKTLNCCMSKENISTERSPKENIIYKALESRAIVSEKELFPPLSDDINRH